MSLHTNEEGNSQQSQEGSIADTIKELIIIILKKNCKNWKFIHVLTTDDSFLGVNLV